ncbi:hypothetical protein HS088_TW10G00471 [Tripterygium wilfordii]|uniref:B-like cyclin n=1 Tax=Tripterygium wilfordii TaxID=458696 RepID=A0A7J7D557_TRIWF|nr:putative cyclin-D6-1 [Tripterygium wilfordii]KAF5741474.1 hypothetical protein HS088_TW10G00471 [Tripterygium wilfordii]
MELDLENPVTSVNDKDSNTVLSLFLIESDHIPTHHYLKMLKARDSDVSVRREAISSIEKISCNFDPLLSYLAINYFDRFLSNQRIPQPKPWAIKLLSIACVSLAAKMRKTELSFTDIQGVGGFIFDPQTMQRMEFLVLGALKWRMRSITPFAFISYFISLFKLEDPPLMQALKARSINIIFKAQHDIKFLEFKPSVISASALLSTSHEMCPLQYPCFRNAILACSYVNKESMQQCYNTMQEIAIDGYDSLFDAVSSSDTPVNVLDRHFSSAVSEKTNGTTTITANGSSSVRTERDIKRRKITGHYNNNNQTVQISQVQHC